MCFVSFSQTQNEAVYFGILPWKVSYFYFAKIFGIAVLPFVKQQQDLQRCFELLFIPPLKIWLYQSLILEMDSIQFFMEFQVGPPHFEMTWGRTFIVIQENSSASRTFL